MPAPLTDARIDVDDATAQRIAQVLCGEIGRSLAANKPIYDRGRRNQQAYNQITKYMAQHRLCDTPWPGASDYFIGLVEWTVDAVWARVMSTLFSKEPYMTATGQTADDKPREDGVTEFVDAILREKVRLYDVSNYGFKQSLVLPFAVFKYEWVSEYDRLMRKEQAVEFVSPDGQREHVLQEDVDPVRLGELIANGYQQSPEPVDVWTVQDVELSNQPKLTYVRLEDYVWAPNAKRAMPPYWEGDRFWLTVNDLRRYAQQDKFRKEAVERIAAQQTGKSSSPVDRDIQSRADLLECFTWYGKLPFDAQGQVNFEDSEAIEQEVVAVLAYQSQELLQLKHWDNRRLPVPERVYLRLLFEETDDFGGRSLADKLYMTNKQLNTLHNTIQNNAMISMQKMFVKKRNLAGDRWEKPVIYPGAVFTEDQTGDVRVLEVGDVKRIGQELEGSLLGFAERISNVSIFTTGSSRKEGGQKTLGEVQRTVYEGNIGMDKFIQRCHNLLRTICQWTVDYYYDRMPPGLERRIRGDENQLIFPTPENLPQFQQRGVNPNWTSDDIAGQFDFVWRGTSLNSSEQYELAVANDLMERYLTHPMVSGNLLATWEVLKRGLLARGIKDWDTILPKREAILQEMQRMQQQQQQRQRQMPPQQGADLKRRVVEKLTQRGVPPAQAEQALAGGGNGRLAPVA